MVTEPDWTELEVRLYKLTLVKIRRITRAWFGGMLGGESTKRGIIQEMISQMRCSWHDGRTAWIEGILDDLDRIEKNE